MSGHVACLVTADHEVSGAGGDEVSSREVHWVGGSGPGRKRIRLNRKNPCTRRWFSDSMSSTGVEEIASSGGTRLFLSLITRGGALIRVMRVWFLLRSRLEWDDFLGSLQAHPSRSACL